MNNMLGDCYAAVVIQEVSQKELKVMPDATIDMALDDVDVV